MMLIDVSALTVGYPLPSPSPRALIVDKKTGDCSHAPLQLPRLSVSRRYHPTHAPTQARISHSRTVALFAVTCRCACCF